MFRCFNHNIFRCLESFSSWINLIRPQVDSLLFCFSGQAFQGGRATQISYARSIPRCFDARGRADGLGNRRSPQQSGLAPYPTRIWDFQSTQRGRTSSTPMFRISWSSNTARGGPGPIFAPRRRVLSERTLVSSRVSPKRKQNGPPSRAERTSFSKNIFNPSAYRNSHPGTARGWERVWEMPGYWSGGWGTGRLGSCWGGNFLIIFFNGEGQWCLVLMK